MPATAIMPNFCGPRLGRRVFAGKGMSGTRPGFQMSRGKKAKTSRLAIIGVDVIKSAIFDRLARELAIRFSNSLEAVYFEQLASERRVIRYKRGQPSRRFERIAGRRAKALDALVYAHAARQAVQINFDQRASELAATPMPMAPRVTGRSGCHDKRLGPKKNPNLFEAKSANPAPLLSL